MLLYVSGGKCFMFCAITCMRYVREIGKIVFYDTTHNIPKPLHKMQQCPNFYCWRIVINGIILTNEELVK